CPYTTLFRSEVILYFSGKISAGFLKAEIVVEVVIGYIPAFQGKLEAVGAAQTVGEGNIVRDLPGNIELAAAASEAWPVQIEFVYVQQVIANSQGVILVPQVN